MLSVRLLALAALALPLLGCGASTATATSRSHARAPRAAAAHRTTLTSVAVATETDAEPAIDEPTPAPIAETSWFFESLSLDGKRALLRELDPRSRATFHVRSVEVDSGRVLEDVVLPELAKIPAATIGSPKAELAALEWMLASPAFAHDLVRGAKVIGGFPFGEGGRLAATTTGSAVAFDAGDWLYVTDEAGHPRRRLVDEAAYDPRFTPDGRSILFRRAVATGDVFARYDLEVVPSDLSAPPRSLPNTAGVRDRFTLHPDGQSATVISSQPRRLADKAEPKGDRRTEGSDICVLSIGLRAPFPTKKLACLEGGEALVEFVVSPKAKWAAISTKRRGDAAGGKHLQWRLRVLSLATGKVVRDEPDVPGLGIRAISDGGLLVQSGTLGAIVHDVPNKGWRELPATLDLGHRGFFRNDKELVYVAGGSVAVIDVSTRVLP